MLTEVNAQGKQNTVPGSIFGFVFEVKDRSEQCDLRKYTGTYVMGVGRIRIRAQRKEGSLFPGSENTRRGKVLRSPFPKIEMRRFSSEKMIFEKASETFDVRPEE